MTWQEFGQMAKEEIVFTTFAYFMPIIAMWVLATKGPQAAKAVIKKRFEPSPVERRLTGR